MAQRKQKASARREGQRKRGGGLTAMAGAVLEGIGKMARSMGSDDNLDATDLLKAQHRYVEKLFAEIQKSNGARKGAAFRELADMLAIHATIEAISLTSRNRPRGILESMYFTCSCDI